MGVKLQINSQRLEETFVTVEGVGLGPQGIPELDRERHDILLSGWIETLLCYVD